MLGSSCENSPETKHVGCKGAHTRNVTPPIVGSWAHERHARKMTIEISPQGLDSMLSTQQILINKGEKAARQKKTSAQHKWPDQVSSYSILRCATRMCFD